jgi:hypothetical protein
MVDSPQIGKMTPNFLKVGFYKNRLGKIRFSNYQGFEFSKSQTVF